MRFPSIEFKTIDVLSCDSIVEFSASINEYSTGMSEFS